MGNHIHFRFRFKRKDLYKNFIRAATGQIASYMIKKVNCASHFWTETLFTRILKTSFENWILKNYLHANEVERKFGYEAREEVREDGLRLIYGGTA